MPMVSLLVRTVLSRHQDIFRDYCHPAKLAGRSSQLTLREPTHKRACEAISKMLPLGNPDTGWKPMLHWFFGLLSALSERSLEAVAVSPRWRRDVVT